MWAYLVLQVCCMDFGKSEPPGLRAYRLWAQARNAQMVLCDIVATCALVLWVEYDVCRLALDVGVFGIARSLLHGFWQK